jgi:hypothetical protein
MSEEPVNTGENRGRFVKGDKRINRRGRPRTFDALRKLAVKIAGENVPESEVTRIEAMLRVMSTSRNPADRALFLAYAYGKPKESIEHSGELTTKVIIEYSDDQVTETPPSPTPDKTGAEEV